MNAAAQMMADLGLVRRDVVSAPEDKKNQRQISAHEQAEIQRDFAARRAKATSAPATSGEDERTARIRAWNNESAFEPDEVAAQLDNRFNGQGHRAAMRRGMGYDERAEAIDNIVGEERRLYLQEHDGKAPNGGRGAKARDMVNSHDRGRGTAAPFRAPNPNRAPSPRSFGRKRFVNDQIVNQTGAGHQPSNRAANRANTQATATSRAPAVLPPAPQQSSMPSRPPKLAPSSSAIPIRAPSLSAQSNGSLSSRTTRRSGGGGGRGPRRPHKTTTPSTLPALLNPAAIEVYRCQALWYAAHPGQESNLYHEKFPERKSLLEEAMGKLVKETVLLIRKDDARDTGIYIETHPERAWMVNLARQAMVIVEYSTNKEINDYCQTHPKEEPFVLFASTQFTSKIRRDSMVATEETMPGKPFPDVGESTSRQMSDGLANGIAKTEKTTSGTERNEDVVMANTAAESGKYTETVVAEPEYVHANGAMQPQTPTPAFASEAVNNDGAATTASNRVPKARAAISNGSSTVAESSPARETNSSSNASTPNAPTTIAQEIKGALAATFYNSVGEFLGIHQMGVQAPVHATMSVTSRAAEFDPRSLILQIENLAQNMANRANGVNGHKLVDYESDEEL